MMQMFVNEHNAKISSWRDWSTRAATPTDLNKTTYLSVAFIFVLEKKLGKQDTISSGTIAMKLSLMF